MSSISFQDEHDEALVSGSERGMCDLLTRQIADAIVDVGGITRWGSPNGAQLASLLGIAEWELEFLVNPATKESRKMLGHSWNMFHLQLNTAQVVGGDALKFCARMHGQCEIHAWVNGSNRQWLANIITGGLSTGILRESPLGYGGWRVVIDLLEKRSDCPVVTSYSVCEGFPNAWLVREHLQESEWPDSLSDLDQSSEHFNEDFNNAFWDLDGSAQWALAMAALKLSGGSLEMTPDNWNDYYFGDGRTAFDLRKAINETLTKQRQETATE